MSFQSQDQCWNNAQHNRYLELEKNQAIRDGQDDHELLLI